VPQATEIYSSEFDRKFSALPVPVQERIEEKIHELGRQLKNFPHVRLSGRSEFRIRIGNHRVIYEFDLEKPELYLITLGHRREIYRR
jgi:mRNA interferase RelE/StbE